MTLPDPQSPRKVRRWGLVLPYAMAIILAAGWCAGWFWVRGQAERQMDAQRDRLVAAGYPISWQGRRIDGFPFRLDLHLTGVRIGEPSGWGLAIPRLEAEAYAYSPDHWIMVAPEGVTFNRPNDGGVAVQARGLRASLSHFGEYPPRLSVEGEDLAFTAAPGAKPYFITAAKAFNLHLRAGPNDMGAVYVGLDQANANLTGLMARIAQGKPIAITADALFTRAGQFQGRDWPSAVQGWSGAGGAFQVRQITVAAGESILDARSGALSVGPDGRLQGSLKASLRQAPKALAAMSQSGAISRQSAEGATSVAEEAQQGDAANLTLDFQDGQTTLGPVTVGPAPKVY
ncbi:MAG TPA: DUF2125 domain-containing protein [Caulobacteraceae bacterium]